jgi:hypothetical protein
MATLAEAALASPATALKLCRGAPRRRPQTTSITRHGHTLTSSWYEIHPVSFPFFL